MDYRPESRVFFEGPGALQLRCCAVALLRRDAVSPSSTLRVLRDLGRRPGGVQMFAE